MSLSRWAIARPVATVAAVLGVVLLGSVSLSRMPVSLLPDVTLPVLTIRTNYPGAAATEVSRFVGEPIEEAIAATPGLVELRSVSRNGEVTTTARFGWGTDMRTTVLNVRERLDATRGRLPERAERPTLLTSDPGERPIAVLGMRATSSAERAARDSLQGSVSGGLGVGDLRGLARTAEDVFARRLEQIAGVASVAVVGAPADEIRVDVNPDRLRALSLTPEDVAQAIRVQNSTGAGGTVRRGQFRFSVRALTEFRDLEEILSVPIGAQGSGITLRDVATASIALADPVTITRLDGRESIGLVVYKDAGSNTVSVTNRMMEAVESLEAEFPAVELTVVASQAEFVVDALSNLGQEIVVGGLMSLLMILVFLRDWRVSMAIGLMVPLSVMVALVTLQTLGVTINVLSLGGLALGTGILVDTAIVVAEGVGRRREEGMGYIDAAIVGTEEVSGPLLAGTLTTMLVFGPIIFVQGLAAALFRDLSLSVVMTVGASLLLSLTLMPVMMVGQRRRAMRLQANPQPKKAPGPTGAKLDAFGTRIADMYEHGMSWSLRNPVPVFAGGLVLLVVMVVLFIRLPKEVLPRVDEGVLVAEVQLPEGTAIEATTAAIADIERASAAMGAQGVYARVGRATDEEILSGANPGSSATAQLIVPVPDGESAARFAQQLRDSVPQLVAQGALAIDLAGQSEFGSLIGREGRIVRVEVSGASLDDSQRWADSVRTMMRGVTTLSDVRDAFAATQPVIEVSLLRERMAERGITPAQVASALQGGLGGVASSELRETDRRTPIRVRYEGVRNEELETALNTSLNGVPVSQLVEVKETRAPLEVVRIGQRPVSIVEGLVEEGGTAKAASDVARNMEALGLPATVSWQVAGADSERKRTSDELALVGVLAVLLVFLVLAGEFSSFTIPLVVITTVPLAAAGGVIFLWATGQSINAVSLIGIVIMVGMADNEAVVKLDAIRRFREMGHSVNESVLLGGRQRLRAITMTSLTTITGVLPLMLGMGSGGALYRPLAAAVIGGSISALVVTFFLLPTVYSVVERNLERRRNAQDARDGGSRDGEPRVRGDVVLAQGDAL
jgi:HAE1 family hydrophobic/amphiphilic exporter-1